MDHLEIIKSVYKRFIDKKEKHKRLVRIKPIAQGAVSSVFSINSNIVGKVASMIETPANAATKPFLDNKMLIWDYLRSRFESETDDYIKSVLDKLVSLPIYRNFYKKHLVSLEPVIKGKTMKNCILDTDSMSTDLKASDVHFLKILYILFDVLLYLGTKFKFNHNDLHFDNVMIVKAKDLDLCEYHSIYFNSIGKPVKLTDVKYVPVILDFDWATIAGYAKVKTDDERGTLGSMRLTLKNFINNKEESFFANIHKSYGSDTTEQWSPVIDVAMFLEMFKSASPDRNSSLATFINIAEVPDADISHLQNNKNYTFVQTIINQNKIPYHIYRAFGLLHLIDGVIIG